MSTERLNMPFLMFRIVTVILKLTWSASELKTVAIQSLQKQDKPVLGYLALGADRCLPTYSKYRSSFPTQRTVDLN